MAVGLLEDKPKTMDSKKSVIEGRQVEQSPSEVLRLDEYFKIRPTLCVQRA
jgi:hypothetical protein